MFGSYTTADGYEFIIFGPAAISIKKYDNNHIVSLHSSWFREIAGGKHYYAPVPWGVTFRTEVCSESALQYTVGLLMAHWENSQDQFKADSCALRGWPDYDFYNTVHAADPTVTVGFVAGMQGVCKTERDVLTAWAATIKRASDSATIKEYIFNALYSDGAECTWEQFVKAMDELDRLDLEEEDEAEYIANLKKVIRGEMV